MRTILIGLWMSVPALFAEEVARPQGPEESVGAVVKEFEAAVGEYREAVSEAKTPDERKEVLGRLNERKNDLARRAMQLAQDRPKDAVAVEALTWIVSLRTTPLTAAALQILHRDHLDNEAILPACWYSTASPGRDSETLLRDASMKSQSHRVRGLASFYLAGFLKDRAKDVRHLKAHPEDRARFERLFGAEGVAMKGKPFVLLSVNAEMDEKALRKAIASDEIMWKCWLDLGTDTPGSGPICQRLGINVFPTIFVIDPNGVIRDEGVQGDRLDEAVDRLLIEAGASGHGF